MSTGSSGSRWRATALPFATAALCFGFGLLLIAQTQSAGDGVWFWYARLFLDGRHLYRDLGLAQQPLYILLNAAMLWLLGPSWIASKALAVASLVGFLAPTYALAVRGGQTSVERAALVAFTFFVGIHFEAYRFDDYHVIVDDFFLLGIVVLLRLREATSPRWFDALAATLGVLFGASLMTRLNDGLVFGASVGVLALVFAPTRRARVAAVLTLTTGTVVVVALAAVGDTPSDWWHASISGGAAAKGGMLNLLRSPLLLPRRALSYCTGPAGSTTLLHLVALLGGVWLGAREYGRPAVTWAIRATLALVLYVSCWLVWYGDPIIVSAAVFAIVAYLSGAWITLATAWRLARDRRVSPDDHHALLLIPLALWLSGSLSTGGWHLGLYFPFALFGLLLAITDAPAITRGGLRWPFAVFLIALANAGASYRFERPFSWHSYRSPPLLHDRTVIRHDHYGPMVIDRELLNFIRPICAAVGTDRPVELLSLPFPYANYFCGIAPWRDYVQTFFDTSRRQTIDRLSAELDRAPPRWILYQRQMANLAQHERIYNGGRPLAHRELDRFIEGRIRSGRWIVVRSTAYLPESQWLLIRTR